MGRDIDCATWKGRTARLGKPGQQLDLETGAKQVTTIYITESEFDLLSSLSALAVSKVRAIVGCGVIDWAIDTYPDGTVIAETEETVESLPDWIGEEITGKAEGSGARLATTCS